MFTYTPCEWTEQPERPGYWTCAGCGVPYGGATPRASETKPVARRKCEPRGDTKPRSARVVKADSPSIAARVKSYKSARERWKAAGSPLRTDEEKRAIYSICERCPTGDFNPDNAAAAFGFAGGECKVCKCGLSPERVILNKIAWATEDCPKGHWPKADKRNPDPDDGRAG